MHRIFDTREGIKIVISDKTEKMVSSVYAFAGMPDNKEMKDRVRDTIDNNLQYGPVIAMLVSDNLGLITLHRGECASQIYKDAIAHGHEILMQETRWYHPRKQGSVRWPAENGELLS